MYAKLLDDKIIPNIKLIEFYIEEGTAYVHFKYLPNKEYTKPTTFTTEVFNVKYISE